MQRHRMVELGREIVTRLEERSTPLADGVFVNDPRIYVDAERFARERRVYFREHPLVMGASCRIPEPGDFFTDELAGVPLIVVRDDEGRARVLANMCRHRGAQVEGRRCGRGSTVFTCPYHGWAYGRSGELRVVSNHADFGPIDTAAHGLVELPSAERVGLIFARPSMSEALDLGPAVDELLGRELIADLATYGLSGFSHFETRTVTRRMNWKLAVDTFTESYHFKALHHDSIYPIMHSNLAPVRLYGPNHLFIPVRRNATVLAEQAEDEWNIPAHTALGYLLFPNTIFTMQIEHIELFRILPTDSVSESTIEVSLYVPEPAETDSAKRHWTKNFDLLMRTADDEDFSVAEGIQRSFDARVLDHVSYGRNEPLMHNYHRALRAGLGETIPPLGPMSDRPESPSRR